MNDGCPARLAFGTAPYMDLVCHRPTGHAGLHETTTAARMADVPIPHVAWSGDDRVTARTKVWMSWNQDVSGDMPLGLPEDKYPNQIANRRIS